MSSEADSGFCLDLTTDVREMRDWLHEFAEKVIRPAGAEWDEREETPWPILEEAAKIGLYSLDFFAQQWLEPSGLGTLVADGRCVHAGKTVAFCEGEVHDSAGKLVGRWASDDAVEAPDPQLAIPPYWVRPPQRLSGGGGHASIRVGPALSAGAGAARRISDRSRLR